MFYVVYKILPVYKKGYLILQRVCMYRPNEVELGTLYDDF